MSSREVINAKLTLKQELFVEAIVEGKSQKEAAISSGSSARVASVQACKMMQHPAVKREIRKRLATLKKQHMTRMNLAYKVIADAVSTRMSDLVDKDGIPLKPHELPEHADNVVDEYEVEEWYDKQGNHHVKRRLKKSSKLEAADKAIKILGGYAPDKLDTRNQNLNANVSLEHLYETPEGAREPDRIEEQVDEEEVSG